MSLALQGHAAASHTSMQPSLEDQQHPWMRSSWPMLALRQPKCSHNSQDSQYALQVAKQTLTPRLRQCLTLSSLSAKKKLLSGQWAIALPRLAISCSSTSVRNTACAMTQRPVSRPASSNSRASLPFTCRQHTNSRLVPDYLGMLRCVA